MALILFLNWWYTAGWINAYKSIPARTGNLARYLSIPTLAQTLFEPWKQITLSAGQNASIDLKMHILAENLFSRFFGFIIRISVIFFGFFAIVFTAIFGLFLALIWPVIPFLPLVFLIMAVASI